MRRSRSYLLRRLRLHLPQRGVLMPPDCQCACHKTRSEGGCRSGPGAAVDDCGAERIGLGPRAEPAQASRSDQFAGELPKLACLRSPSTHVMQSIAAIVLGVSPPVTCAWVAQASVDWSLFERSGYVTAAFGLVLASRRYVQHSVLELAALHANEDLESKLSRVVEDTATAKLGLALSGFGMIISGWGKYLGWWSFSYIAVWVFFILRDARRDFTRLKISGAPRHR